VIISQTPLRVSLLGGGTDFPFYYHQHGGAVLSLGIDKFVYVIVKERFDDLIYVNYSQKEIVSNIDDIQHSLVREAMRLTGVTNGVEITTLSDIPSEGSGLGSSSSITVGLLNALYAYAGEPVTSEQLAQDACEIEREILRKPMGVQDQYIAAYGNLRYIEFLRDGMVQVTPIVISEALKRKLTSNLLLFYTGLTRKATSILGEQQTNIDKKTDQLNMIRDLAFQARNLVEQGNINAIGDLLNQNWHSKKQLASGITLPKVDHMYALAMSAGATGGKIAGAGGGGFLLVYSPRENQDRVRTALSGYKEMPFMLSRYGSKIIFHASNYEMK